jgi:hypothetical protein
MAAYQPGSAFLCSLALLEHPRPDHDNAESIIYDAIILCTPTFTHNQRVVCSLRVCGKTDTQGISTGRQEIFAKIAQQV